MRKKKSNWKGKLYKDLDLLEQGPADRSARTPEACGLGGRDPEKKGWANLAKALAARFEYLLCCTGAGGGGGGGTGEELPRVGNRELSDILKRPVNHDLTR